MSSKTSRMTELERVERFTTIVRQNIIDQFIECFPDQRHGFNVQEITAGMVMAAGQLTVQYIPDTEELPRAYKVLAGVMKRAMLNALDPDSPIFPVDSSPEQSEKADQQSVIPDH